MSSRDKTKKVNSIYDQLGRGVSVAPPPENPDLIDSMLIAVLMEKVSETKAEQAVKRLKTAFVNWNEARVSTGAEIAEEANESGVNERLGRNLRNVLNALYDDRWQFSLEFLKEESLANIRTYLTERLGMEPRPAARLMLFGFGRPALPLTEEGRRVVNRVGLVDPSWSQDRAQKSLERIVPSARMLEFYQLISRHADATCLRTKPKCARCVLRKVCDEYAQQSSATPAKKQKAAPKKAKRSSKKAPRKKKPKKR